MTEVSKTRARQGTTLGRMSHVPIISTSLAALALELMALGRVL